MPRTGRQRDRVGRTVAKSSSICVHYTKDTVEVDKRNRRGCGGHVQFSGQWQNEWRALSFDMTGSGVSLERIAHVRDLGGSLGGKPNSAVSGSGRVAGPPFRPADV